MRYGTSMAVFWPKNNCNNSYRATVQKKKLFAKPHKSRLPLVKKGKNELLLSAITWSLNTFLDEKTEMKNFLDISYFQNTSLNFQRLVFDRNVTCVNFL